MQDLGLETGLTKTRLKVQRASGIGCDQVVRLDLGQGLDLRLGEGQGYLRMLSEIGARGPTASIVSRERRHDKARNALQQLIDRRLIPQLVAV